eukprot:TRINITY_DN4262_c4_g1_i1.p1 TRINITY_DN4262_c4_g1~~TRINITY_DN4262_c4_g1_i1.p1  ORF type:complete len:299 (+),score=96.22 TRINITY_DN4262_c4_g1_i1:66-899(+)
MPGGWYTGDKTYDRLVALELALVLSTAAGVKGKAPYGKFANRSLGSVQLDPRLGWWLMEIPATASFLYHFLKHDPKEKAAEEKKEKTGKGPSKRMKYLLALLWLVHYGNRGWFFPLSIRVQPGTKANFSRGNALVGAIFTGLHGYAHARMFRTHGEHLNDDWFKDPRFIIGLILYEIGFWLTVHSEKVVRNLRAPGAPRYSIPRGGGFNLVTNPHYFGELLGWFGFSMLTWSVPSAAVFTISALNLIPRSFQNHEWYLKKFPEYAKLNRKVLVPFLM